ncbi:MAG: helix-turn-helix transcriptional regulator [Terriglobia bacterium]|jgi:transcriptional regulator with XRE-family HTH domain
MAKIGDRQSSRSGLGPHLARLRNAVGLTLRQVEEATEKEVSNAYLSQLENDRISKPSPNVLYALAHVYRVPYEDLMARAGYLPAQGGTQTATFAIEGLTPEEENALLAYLKFFREQRKERQRR